MARHDLGRDRARLLTGLARAVDDLGEPTAKPPVMVDLGEAEVTVGEHPELLEGLFRGDRSVLDLTEESHGNAVGIGMAEVTTRRLVDKIDYKPTYMNAATAGSFVAVKVPMTMETDREAVAVALRGFDPGTIRLAHIKNTLVLEDLDVSSGLLDEVEANASLTVEKAPLSQVTHQVRIIRPNHSFCGLGVTGQMCMKQL